MTPPSRRRRRWGKLAAMHKRLAAILCLVVLGFSLGGCTKCGWFWEQGGRACHAEPLR
jgi:hypothetical protein